MFDKKTILAINKNVLKRFEHNLEDGIVFLFNIETDKTWTGNAASDCLLRLIDGERTLEDIYKILCEVFTNFSKEDIYTSFDAIVKGLLEQGFLEIKNASN